MARTHRTGGRSLALDALAPARDADGLARWLERWRPPWSWLGAHLCFDPRGYRRVRLVAAPGIEALLLTWLPGHATPVHAHGDSVGAVRLLVGELEERRYEERDGRRIERAVVRYRAPGLLREDRGTVHSVAAVGRGPVVSVHLYSPPISDPRVSDDDA
jgi:predicted metal-dependent enzyme (double-stranded beta helix superfamily)